MVNKIHHYDIHTKEYLFTENVSEEQTQQDLDKPGLYTTKEPPAPIWGKKTIWQGENWIQVGNPYASYISAERFSITAEEKKNILRPIRNNLLNEVDLVYCNAEMWEQMSAADKKSWRDYKQKLRDWIGINWELGTFPERPVK